ncbi:hypothetical protein [Serratia fonticola]|uniref:hypothetical protein n=1 Tax=Serratia fonticola TaxID=47917 RepID=UPI00192B9452|nr:hypothetical protein [Serratia fonticola]MBL5905958.1 hypothetical protein [Serratia fonticola]
MNNMTLACKSSGNSANVLIRDLSYNNQSFDLVHACGHYLKQDSNRDARNPFVVLNYEFMTDYFKISLDSGNKSSLERIKYLNLSHQHLFSSNERKYILNSFNGLFYSLFGNEEVSSPYNAAIRKLDGLRQHVNEVEDVDLPTNEAIEDARSFIENNLRKHGLVIPKIRAISGGEINFYWDNSEAILDVAILGDGTFSFYSKVKDSKLEFCDDKKIIESLPEAITDKLKVR